MRLGEGLAGPSESGTEADLKHSCESVFIVVHAAMSSSGHTGCEVVVYVVLTVFMAILQSY